MALLAVSSVMGKAIKAGVQVGGARRCGFGVGRRFAVNVVAVNAGRVCAAGGRSAGVVRPIFWDVMGGAELAWPIAWRSVVMPGGSIGAILGQLALAGGEEVEFSSGDGRLLIGGRVLIGAAGNPFQFGSAEAAEKWAAIVLGRFESELRQYNGLSSESQAAFRAARRAVGEKRADRLICNAARVADGSVQAALAAEAGFYVSKWGW